MPSKRIWIPVILGLLLFVQKMYQIVCAGQTSTQCSFHGFWPFAQEERHKPCSCKQCISEVGVSDWFDRHFNSSVNPLLTAKNPEIPLSVQRWWLKLQGSSNPEQVQEALDKLFDVFPAEDIYSVRDETMCRTCAVVGNSGNLKGSKYGKNIDSHQIVLRMNGAKTAGFEEDVGSRTTHHFMYPESAVNLPPGVHLVLISFKPQDLKWVASAFSTGELKFTYMRVKQFIKADRDKVLIFNPSFLKYIHDNWIVHHGKYPSTGMLALFFAIHICDEVSVFGYGADSNGDWHHYWERNRFAGAFRRTRVHNAEFELDLIRQLAYEGKVTYHP
ncbi:CMP-N-acetylneuraminate-beta-galactosamide-alpha-2,3-sialyltransferase 2-like [Ambystoma mexicanum]|uniref:CMP-N-acetylneuraminate-beta-galactosamide- alpha-2,3-sialyltransferase 2-like n=1 Tax=Ambystoma mexicanum TaxID=8296 RepID=UPI0037E70A36